MCASIYDRIYVMGFAVAVLAGLFLILKIPHKLSRVVAL